MEHPRTEILNGKYLRVRRLIVSYTIWINQRQEDNSGGQCSLDLSIGICSRAECQTSAYKQISTLFLVIPKHVLMSERVSI